MQCDRATYLNQIATHFPQLLAWVEWCCTIPAKLFFGQHRILSTSGVQQGDPLGPLLFSLTLLHFMGSLGLQYSILLHLWYMYLDDGLFIGTPHDIHSFISENPGERSRIRPSA